MHTNKTRAIEHKTTHTQPETNKQHEQEVSKEAQHKHIMQVTGTETEDEEEEDGVEEDWRGGGVGCSGVCMGWI